MNQRTAHVAAWAISLLAPRSLREVLVGDLAEEYALRAATDSAPVLSWWYLRQICGSVAPLLWARIAQPGWIFTTGVALGAYLAIGEVELIVNATLAGITATHAAYNPLGMAITFPGVVLIGYLTAGFRRGAPLVLTALMLLSVTSMTLWGAESLPTWYRIAYFLIGPAAVFIGGGLRSRRVASVS